ncbi:hypothetical protein HF285_12250 [Acidithiobacillus ferrooxidans F221]|uniref:hypothetical protein n=1 Tax=Acidithiobacillus ferrooxidans TaxID=920 RepID=UPI001C067FD2|nr:hypothetical protein [Acidithiobacillus ferrooxidans]MBU2809009.1 hypothetical protein [Acidithiobacillus ferrooxidans F221]
MLIFLVGALASLPALAGLPKQSAVIHDNTAFWRQRFDITPMILYPTPNGIRGIFGLPDQHRLRMIYRKALRTFKTKDQEKAHGTAAS